MKLILTISIFIIMLAIALPASSQDATKENTSKPTPKHEVEQHEEEKETLTKYERNLVNKVRNCCKWGVIAAKKGYHCHVKSINADRLFNMITTKKLKLESRTSINRRMHEIKEMSKCKEFHKTFAKCCRREIISQKKRDAKS